VTTRRVRPPGSIWLAVVWLSPGHWRWVILRLNVNGWHDWLRHGHATDGRTALNYGLMALAEPTPVVPRAGAGG
jgi:hypothetical protein